MEFCNLFYDLLELRSPRKDGAHLHFRIVPCTFLCNAMYLLYAGGHRWAYIGCTGHARSLICPPGTLCTEKKTVQRTPPNPNGRPKAVFDEATCMQLYQKGMSDIKIGKHFGLSKNPIAAWRARNNLPSNSRSPQARMAFLNGR